MIVRSIRRAARLSGNPSHENKSGHAERDGGDRRENLDGGVAAGGEAGPGFEAARRPIGERLAPLGRSARGIIVTPNPLRHPAQQGDEADEARDNRQQVSGASVAGQRPGRSDEATKQTVRAPIAL